MAHGRSLRQSGVRTAATARQNSDCGRPPHLGGCRFCEYARVRERLRYRGPVLRLLALDFDGVISNSAPEAFVVALRTYVAMKEKTALRDPSARISGEAAPALDVVRGHELYRPFLELMPLGNRA